MKRFFHISLMVLFAIALFACSEETKEEQQQPAEDQTALEQPAQQQPDETAQQTDAEVPQQDERVVKEEDTKDAPPKEASKGEEKKEAPAAASSGEMDGYVISMNDLVTSNPKRLNAAQATALTEKGQLVLFYSNNTPYFVYHADGSFAGKRLAKMADAGFIKIKGTVKNKSGLKILIADEMIMEKN
jgi:FtsZ-interacting cell division protein ZipA